jgi:hypothetical protein
MRKIFLITIALLGFSACTSSSAPTGYPSTYKKISSSEKSIIAKKYEEKYNNSLYEFAIDDYGFISSVIISDREFISPEKSLVITVTEDEIDRVKQLMMDNAEGFGIDSNQKVVFHKFADNIYLADGSISGHELISSKTMLSERGGYQVTPEAKKTIRKDPNSGENEDVIVIIGHFWPGTELPTEPSISESEIRNRYIGRVITNKELDCSKAPPQFRDPGNGEPHPDCFIKESKEAVTDANLQVTKGADMFVNKKGDLEIRLIYQLELKNNKSVKEYVDAITGKEVEFI